MVSSLNLFTMNITLESKKTGLTQVVTKDEAELMQTSAPGKFMIVPNDDSKTPPEARTARPATKEETPSK